MKRLEKQTGGNLLEGASALVGEFLKGTFVAGLKDERVKYIVKTKGEQVSMAQLVETALQEESECKSQRFKTKLTGQGQLWSQRDKEKYHQERKQYVKRESNMVQALQCYMCQSKGHMAKDCRNKQTSEKGTRLIDHQEFQKGVVCASSLVLCENNAYSCMALNKSSNPIRITGAPTLQKLPSRQAGNVCTEVRPRQERARLLNQKLRLDYVTEGSEEIRKGCGEFVDIFKLPGDKLSSTTAAEHVIPTPEIPKGRAITLKNYKLTEAHQKEISKQVEQMLEDGFRKKMDASGERKWRLCIDFRKLNEVTVEDSYPLPHIQDILDKLGRGRYFTALDCASGYLQVPIAKEDQCKTAFSTPMGHYEYKRMPFGLKSAPSTFQRMMNNILGELLGTKALAYIDDILVTGGSLAEHNQKLRQIFSKMREYNLKIEPDKCDFLKQELTYLGHVVTPDGVKPDPKKTEAILKFPIPKNPKDVKSFLGLAGYYRKFISDFSAIARPLTNLLKKEISWTWDEREQNSFEMLQAKLSSAPLLQYPDFTKPFIITTNASGYAIGAILSQGKLGQDKPISYANRTLIQAELHYTTTEKELLAVVWACKHFRPYVFGGKFQIVTDHKGLIWIFNVKDPSSRLIRWKLLLEEYDYEIVHRAGKRHCNADSLSRNPISCMITTEEISVLQKSGRPQYNYDDFVMDLKSRLQNTFRTAKDRLRSHKVKQQERGYYDKGDLVLLQVENKHKLDALWKGPFEVIEDRDPNVVIQEEFIFSDSIHQHYGKLTSNELQLCFQPNELHFVCKEEIPLYTYVQGMDCEASLPFIHTEGCKGYSPHVTLYAMQIKDSNSSNDVVPIAEVNFDCCFDENKNADKIPNIPIHVPLVDVLSSQDDLRLASIKPEEIDKLITEEGQRTYNYWHTVTSSWTPLVVAAAQIWLTASLHRILWHPILINSPASCNLNSSPIWFSVVHGFSSQFLDPTVSPCVPICHFRETDFEESSLLKRSLMKDNRTPMKMKKTSVPFLFLKGESPQDSSDLRAPLLISERRSSKKQ
ncbi:hypothetical protein ANN_08726 [Periplaneta americana]|uniref:Retrovirus-related Pol polyprotein from transposon 17.6 n=1 Tax=Periplaneta americana TaxID=6978 RepID=A0ABQ8T3L0_PERAM|nr:hypothetical protein ANN_08726 [Periplaneta americana]